MSTILILLFCFVMRSISSACIEPPLYPIEGISMIKLYHNTNNIFNIQKKVSYFTKVLPYEEKIHTGRYLILFTIYHTYVKQNLDEIVTIVETDHHPYIKLMIFLQNKCEIIREQVVPTINHATDKLAKNNQKEKFCNAGITKTEKTKYTLDFDIICIECTKNFCICHNCNSNYLSLLCLYKSLIVIFCDYTTSNLLNKIDFKWEPYENLCIEITEVINIMHYILFNDGNENTKITVEILLTKNKCGYLLQKIKNISYDAFSPAVCMCFKIFFAHIYNDSVKFNYLLALKCGIKTLSCLEVEDYTENQYYNIHNTYQLIYVNNINYNLQCIKNIILNQIKSS
ncbi:hypothetical protein COBT_002157 [Conglomerata obtusa]